ncbi:MAG: TatD family hydrolase [Spirochaetales bacterium]|nr:TatD family hydrolase [Spirochaetales bacterium]
MKYFDTHAHIGLIHEDPIEQLIIVKEAKHAGVEHIVSISNNIMDFFDVYQNLLTAENVFFAAGLSPSEVANPPSDWEMKLEKAVSLDRVIAIGETGLDYYRKFGSKNNQVELFIRHLELADKYNLPVIIHNREAGADVLDILRNNMPRKGGVLHCYSEDYDYARKALDLNLYISFAGNLTYRNAKNLHETARNIPIDRILVESESPFMVPAHYRGKRNRPAYIWETIQYLAEIRGENEEDVSEIVFQNSLNFFNLNK